MPCELGDASWVASSVDVSSAGIEVRPVDCLVGGSKRELESPSLARLSAELDGEEEGTAMIGSNHRTRGERRWLEENQNHHCKSTLDIGPQENNELDSEKNR